MTTTDIAINGVLFIAQIDLNEDGTSTISLTEACNHPVGQDCNAKTFDFKEFIA